VGGCSRPLGHRQYDGPHGTPSGSRPPQGDIEALRAQVGDDISKARGVSTITQQTAKNLREKRPLSFCLLDGGREGAGGGDGGASETKRRARTLRRQSEAPELSSGNWKGCCHGRPFNFVGLGAFSLCTSKSNNARGRFIASFKDGGGVLLP
jgi:hypothetical protein